jgi:hypothetical protein
MNNCFDCMYRGPDNGAILMSAGTGKILCRHDCFLYDEYTPYPIPWTELFPEGE